MEARIIGRFHALIRKRLIRETSQLRTYECDGLTNFRVLPHAVLLPDSSAEVQAIVQICSQEKIPFVARGSGTGLSGGALPVDQGIVISLARMNHILEVIRVEQVEMKNDPGMVRNTESLPRGRGGEVSGKRPLSYFAIGVATTSCSLGFSRILLKSSSL